MRSPSPGIALLLAAIALGWLSLFDRQSPAALRVVEWDGRLGVPLYSVAGVMGVGLLATWVVRKVLGRATRPPQPVLRARPGPAPLGGDWRREITRRARELELEDGAHVEVDPRPGIAFALVLDRMPPKRARRALVAFTEFLASIPTPPAVRIAFRDVLEGGAPRHHLVAGLLARHFRRQDFRVVSAADQIDVRFHHADPRWG